MPGRLQVPDLPGPWVEKSPRKTPLLRFAAQNAFWDLGYDPLARLLKAGRAKVQSAVVVILSLAT